MSTLVSCTSKFLIPPSSEGWTRLWTPLTTQLRYSNRPNLQRPLPLHYRRVRVREVCKPIYPKLLPVCGLSALEPKKEADYSNHPYGQFLVRKFLNNFKSHPMIAIFHTNSHSEHDFLKIRGMLFDANIDITIQRSIGVKVPRLALEGTQFQPVLRLLESQFSVGFMNEPETLPKLIKILKKIPQFILIGLVYQGRLLHRDDIDKLSTTTLEEQRALLAHTLGRVATSLTSTLQTSQLILSNNLTSLSKMGNDSEVDSPKSSSTSSSAS